MRPLLLAILPIVFFAGALMTAGTHQAANQAADFRPAPEPASASKPAEFVPLGQPTKPVEQPSQNSTPEPPKPTQKVIVYVNAQNCTDGEKSVIVEEGLTPVPIDSQRAQCQDPVGILKDGKEYFGCQGGKIILDCDWFVQTAGAETTTENAQFGNSSLVDFSIPDKAVTCQTVQANQDSVLHIDGKICDLQTVVGNLNQMHGG